MPKTTILSVDDDKDLQTVVGHYLTSEGHKMLPAYSGEQARQLLSDAAPGLVLLDLGLPDTDGITLLGQIRASVKIPVIVVSGKSDTTEKIVCLEMGADDYMTKPFEMRELSARIKAVLRRANEVSPQLLQPVAEAKPPSRVRFGTWIMDRAQFQIFNDKGESGELTTGEYKLLDAMVSTPNMVLTRERLFELTRENEYDSFDRAVDIQVGRLRKKLDDDPKEPRYIKTVRGIGYMFCGEAEIL